ncbi:MAG TPA: hypothetical protein VF138_01325 [Caulobacteraceae bacterium]
MRLMMMAAAAVLGMATSAAAAEPAACYDAAVVGWLTDYANERYIDNVPVPADRVLPRMQADALVETWSQVNGEPLPKTFWARAILTEAPRPSGIMLVYLKTQPDGVPAIVGYRYEPQVYKRLPPSDYPAC